MLHALRFALTVLLAGHAAALRAAPAPAEVKTSELEAEIRGFLAREISPHLSDIHTLTPPPDRVLGARTTGEFSWGTFMRAVSTYAELSGDREIAGKDLPRWIGQVGLIEARGGGRSFAQLYAAMALESFGADLTNNPLWQSLSPQEKDAWRSLLDPGRFYDRKTRTLIHLPENYFGVAARITAISYRLGLITDKSLVDDLLDRAVQQFTSGALFADDDAPTGRFDRYSNEYARYCYFAAETAGRTEIMKALEPTLKEQMRLWWDLLSPDGYGYPWGRSLGAISYMDTMEIVGFLGVHPEFRPAPLPVLAAAYRAAWEWLLRDYQTDRHLLGVFRFGRGNYAYINPEREWQQTTAFFGKIAGAEIYFERAMKAEGLASFPADLQLPSVHRFVFFRIGDRPAGVWLVREGLMRFALPIVSGTQPGVSDYLPAPYGLPGFAAPVEQFVPVLTPFIELSDGRVVVAAGGADQILVAADGRTLFAVWKRWAQLGKKSGQTVELGLSSEVSWELQEGSLVRTETIVASADMKVRRFWLVVPTSADRCEPASGNDAPGFLFGSHEGNLKVVVTGANWPFTAALHATGDTPLGKGTRGYIPLYLELEGHDFTLRAGQPMTWRLTLTPSPARADESAIARVSPNPDVVH